jgi:hypothetical protein
VVTLASTEWGAVADGREGDQARASWSPTWIAHVRLPPHRQLSISISSSVRQINCQLVAPGVAMNWAIPYSNTETTPDGITDFTVALSCTSGGLHDISRRLVSGWVNGEQVLIDMTVLNAPRVAL